MKIILAIRWELHFASLKVVSGQRGITVRESDPGKAKFLNIAGTAAELVMQLRHFAAIVAGISFVVSVVTSLVEQHIVIFSVAICVFAGSVGIFVACVRVERGWKDRLVLVFQKLSECEKARQKFESEVLTFDESPSADSKVKIVELHHAFLTALCMAAVSIFETLKHGMGKFQANIKRVILIGGVPHYSPIANSYADDVKRCEYDGLLTNDPKKIEDCYTYDQMFTEQITADYFMHHDTRELVDLLSRDKFFEPNPTTPSFYRSMAVHAISGKRTKPGGGSWYCYRDVEVAGIMCVDSRKAGAFRDVEGPERALTLAVLEQLTRHAFASFRLVDAADHRNAMLSSNRDAC